MKTIVIAHNYSEISFAAMSYHFANYLASIGNKVIFISHKPYFEVEKTININSGSLIICSWSTQKRPTGIKDFVWYSKIHIKYKPDIIIGHFVGSNITILTSKILSFGKVKTFEYYHTLTKQLLADKPKVTLKQKLLFLRKKIFYNFFCDVLICPSELAEKDLENFFKSKKGLVLLNAMNDRFEKKSKISDDLIVISYLGRLDASKGVLDFIEAFTIYKQEFSNSKIILNIAGSGSQETLIIQKAKNNPAINFLGSLSYDLIDDYLNKSHFVIIPSKFDNLPTVGLEALMNKTPVLISNSTGLSEYLTDDKDSFKFDPNTYAMVSLFKKVENNFQNYEEMSKNARITFLEKFSINNYCESLFKIVS